MPEHSAIIKAETVARDIEIWLKAGCQSTAWAKLEYLIDLLSEMAQKESQ